jgi:adenine-specific DNA-methyltransferase
MAKKYTGSLSLEWFNKQKSILVQSEEVGTAHGDVPAPKINWINKDEALFYEIIDEEGKGLSPYWVDRSDLRVREARPLIFKKVYHAIDDPRSGNLVENGYKLVESATDDPTIENLLIRGDNLLALNALKKLFANRPEEEKIKCIYIDPPFNTEQAFQHYDDNLEHSEWLTMMRDRLTVLKSLLRYDGMMVVHLDTREVHYAKILLDEVMGRDNFIADITYERSSVAGLGQGGVFVNTAESILFYHNGLIALNEVMALDEIQPETLKRYNKYITDFGSRDLIDEFASKSNGKPVKIYKHKNYEIETISLAKYEERKGEIFQTYIDHFDTVFRPFLVQTENQFQHDLISKMDKDSLYSVEYTPSRGKHKDELTNLYYIGKGLIAWLKDTASNNGSSIGKETKLSTVWKHNEIPKADLHNEGGVTFARGKKPENLLQRVFELCTDEDDIVLDCFGGSGSSFAVAHKMKRNWIGVEIGNHAESHIIPRLKAVLDGSDKSGVSKAVGWLGGGSFRFCTLGDSIINPASRDFNWKLGREFIEQSILSSYDFTPDPEFSLTQAELIEKGQQPSIGFHRVDQKQMACIVSLAEPEKERSFLYDEIMVLYDSLKKFKGTQSITVFTNRGVELAYDSKPDDLEVIKVPHAIFAELEK